MVTQKFWPKPLPVARLRCSALHAAVLGLGFAVTYCGYHACRYTRSTTIQSKRRGGYVKGSTCTSFGPLLDGLPYSVWDSSVSVIRPDQGTGQFVVLILS